MPCIPMFFLDPHQIYYLEILFNHWQGSTLVSIERKVSEKSCVYVLEEIRHVCLYYILADQEE